MKRPALLIAAILLAAPAARAASFDCAKASTDIERMVCDNDELSSLDSSLGRIYVWARSRVDDPNALRSAQRGWLRDIRNACADGRCLKAAYEQRIGELSKIGGMTLERRRAVCDELVAAVNDRTLMQRFVTFGGAIDGYQAPDLPSDRNMGMLSVDYDGDGESEVLGRFFHLDDAPASCMGRGTTCYISDMAAPLSGKPDWEVIRNTRDNCEHLLFVDDVPVIVSADSPGRFTELDYVYWLRPDGLKELLCYVERTDESFAETVTAEDPALCKAVADDKVEFVPWSQDLTIRREELEKYTRYTDVLGTVGAELDIDQDGESEKLVMVIWSSSAGCGSGGSFILEVDRDSMSLVNSPLQNVGTSEMNRTRNRNRQTSWDPSLFEFGGKPYALGKITRADASVASFWNGKMQTWCEYDVRPKHAVGHYYDR